MKMPKVNPHRLYTESFVLQITEFIVAEMIRQGITYSKLARKLGWKTEKLRRFLMGYEHENTIRNLAWILSHLKINAVIRKEN